MDMFARLRGLRRDEHEHFTPVDCATGNYKKDFAIRANLPSFKDRFGGCSGYTCQHALSSKATHLVSTCVRLLQALSSMYICECVQQDGK